MIHFDMPPQKSTIIKVLGFGGGGSNAVNHMFTQKIQNVDFIICNTDAQALHISPVLNKVQLGPHLTQGLGAGANPDIGRQATEESLEEIRRMLEINTKMAFLTAGMGGGTGTGAAPTVARICRELGILTVGIVTTPFAWEGPKRMQQAQDGINELQKHVDTLLVISNDKLRHQFGNLKMKQAFAKADDILTTAARCITDVINSTGQMNVDFADVCTVMKDGGVAILGSATATGENRAMTALDAAINSPLLNDNDIRGAKWILLNITSSEGEYEYTMDEVEMIQSHIRSLSGVDTDVILGMGYNNDMADEIGITIIATGFEQKDPFAKPVVKKVEPKPEPKIEMILGVAGEENKIYGNPVMEILAAAEPIAEPTTEQLMMPTLSEDVTVQLAPEPIKEAESTTPVYETLLDVNVPIIEEPKEVVQDGPFHFELSLDIKEEINNNLVRTVMPEIRDEKPFELPSFLNRPSSIYAPTTETVKEEIIQNDIQEMKLTVLPDMEDMQNTPADKVEESMLEFTLEVKEEQHDSTMQTPTIVFDDTMSSTDEEEQKRKAAERIERLRKLSYNFNNSDNGGDLITEPAYMRRNLNLHNSIANVEDFYSRAQVKTDDNNTGSISTLNNYLHGEQPD